MKTQILAALRSCDGYISGQELCSLLQVSRTAVWKHIRQLQEEGYEIEAVQNRGYRLTGVPDTIAAQEVESRLKTRWIARPVRYFAEITSTNQYAKQIAEEGAEEGILIVADDQTRGKGRSGRSWTSEPGVAIAMTLLLRPSLPPERISMVTLVMGMAVCGAIRDLYGLDAGIKWPNDIVWNGRKICGILTEMSAEISSVAYIVIGTGINVNNTRFPEELADKAVSLKMALGRDINRAELITVCMEKFEQYYEQFLQAGDLRAVRSTYEAMLVNRGRAVRVLEPGHEYNGTAEGIDDLGMLLVRTPEGELKQVYAGEVSVRGIYGYV